METPREGPGWIKGYAEALLYGLGGHGLRLKTVLATCKSYAGNNIDRWKNVLCHNTFMSSRCRVLRSIICPYSSSARLDRTSVPLCSPTTPLPARLLAQTGPRCRLCCASTGGGMESS